MKIVLHIATSVHHNKNVVQCIVYQDKYKSFWLYIYSNALFIDGTYALFLVKGKSGQQNECRKQIPLADQEPDEPSGELVAQREDQELDGPDDKLAAQRG